MHGILVLFCLQFLFGCQTGGNIASKGILNKAIKPEHTGYITIHFYRPLWQMANIHYRPNSSSNKKFKKQAMSKELNGWWQVLLPTTQLQCYLNNNKETVDLGNVSGCYEQVHYPCQLAKEKQNFFILRPKKFG